MKEIVLASQADISQILDIYREAQRYLASQNIPQWQNGYPGLETLKADMKAGGSYVIHDEGKVIATCFISLEPDPCYTVIEDGRWKNSDPYAVLHRTAVLSSCKGHGVAAMFVQKGVELASANGMHNLRADTHRLNHSMRNMLQQQGFEACGTIYVLPHAPRIAYQKIWKEENV